MYGKIFASMFKGSLYGQWEAIVTFTVMIVLADQHGEVDMTPEALSAQTSIPLDIIRRGISDLETPDPKSRTPDEEGRRIVRVSDARDWGWQITNYEHYRTIRSLEERREYMRQYQRTRRSRAVSDVNQPSTRVNNVTQAVSSKQMQRKKEEALTASFNNLSKKEPLPPADKALLALRLAVWVRGHDGSRDINWEKVPSAVRGQTRIAWLASGWNIEDFADGKDFGNTKRFRAGFVEQTSPIDSGESR